MFIQEFYQENVCSVLENANKITLFDNGCEKTLSPETYNNFLSKLKFGFGGARLMPALGVSLHEETLNALENGKWLKFEFTETKTLNGLPFEALLVKLEETGGVNFIREYHGRYDGRCIYVALDQQTDLTKYAKLFS